MALGGAVAVAAAVAVASSTTVALYYRVPLCHYQAWSNCCQRVWLVSPHCEYSYVYGNGEILC